MIACTHPGKIGDALYSLPTVKRISEIHNSKVDFYTSEYCSGLKNLIEYQSYINKFYISKEYQIQSMDMGIQPWKIPVPDGYEKVYHLGYKSVPDKALHEFIASQAGVENISPISYCYPNIDTLDEPYVVLTPHNDSRYMKLFAEFVSKCPYKVVIIGSKDEYPGFGIDKTGLDFLDVLSWLSKCSGFIGMSANYVLSEGFGFPKIVPHDGHTFDMRHLLYDNTHHYLINPTAEDLLRNLSIMQTLSKTLNTTDYDFLSGYSQHFLNIIDHFKHNKMESYRYEHEHRKWEYGVAYKALDLSSSINVLDVGGGGSIFAPSMAWVGKTITQIDPGEVGGWISDQSKLVGVDLPFIQEDFISYKSKTKYDAVTCLSVLEHLPNDVEFFSKLLSFVKPGGIFVLTVDFHPSGRQMVGGHIRSYNTESLNKLIDLAKSKGFEYFGGEPDYSYFDPNVNGCTFASLIMKKKGK